MKFIAEQLHKQVTDGEGLSVFRSLARQTLDRDELLLILKDAHAERPDLWHSWSALAAQYSSMDRLDDAFGMESLAAVQCSSCNAAETAAAALLSPPTERVDSFSALAMRSTAASRRSASSMTPSLAMLKAALANGMLPYTPTIMSWLSAALDTPSKQIVQADIDTFLKA